MKDLITKLEAATEGSRELDEKVLRAVGWFTTDEDAPGYPDGTLTIWHKPNGEALTILRLPQPTRSIDAALTLVPEGWLWSVHKGCDHYGMPIDQSLERYSAEVGECLERMRAKWYWAATPALALNIAVLKARQA